MSRSPARNGYSLVELAVGMTLLVVVLGLPALILGTSSRAYSTSTSVGEVDLATRRALDLLAQRLAASSFTHIPDAAAGPNVAHTQITYQVANGFDGTDTLWSNDERIELRPEPGEAIDGADNDGDGLIDEQEVVLIRDLGLPSERTSVVCRRVTLSLEGELPGNGIDDNGNGYTDEAGLLIGFDGERVVLAVTIERRDAFRVPIVHTALRTVALRN